MQSGSQVCASGQETNTEVVNQNSLFTKRMSHL